MLRHGLALVVTLLLCAVAFTGPVYAQAEPAAEAAADPWGFEEAEEAEPTLLELARDQAVDIALFTAFAVLAMVSFLRKSIPLKYVTLVASVLYMGFYKSQLISVVNIFGLLVGNLPLFSHSMAWYAFAVFTAVTTVLWDACIAAGSVPMARSRSSWTPCCPRSSASTSRRTRTPCRLHQVRHPVRRRGLVSRDPRDRVLPLHRALLDVHLRGVDAPVDRARCVAARDRLRPQPLLPLSLSAGCGARSGLEHYHRVSHQALVRVQLVQALRKDV